MPPTAHNSPSSNTGTDQLGCSSRAPAQRSSRSSYGVSALTPDDVWAVGGQYTGFSPLIEHWDGTQWTIVNSPTDEGSLYAVATVASDDAWAAGYLGSGGGSVPYLLQWDGSTWTPIQI